MAEGKQLTIETRSKLLELLRESIQDLKTRYGKWDIPWGEVHVVGRNKKILSRIWNRLQLGEQRSKLLQKAPLDVRSIEDAKKPGRYVANSGSMAMILMFFDKHGVSSFTCTPWGQSAHPESPHHMGRRCWPLWTATNEAYLVEPVGTKRTYRID